jgi:hypothetical protein
VRVRTAETVFPFNVTEIVVESLRLTFLVKIFSFWPLLWPAKMVRVLSLGLAMRVLALDP